MSSNEFEVAKACAVPRASVACLTAQSFEVPDLLEDSAWIEHAPFAFWLVEALKPDTIVELGVHGGYSYFCFCQAVQRLGLPTRCYGVDTWTGDDHAGFYGDEVFGRVEKYDREHFASFSRLVRSTFDAALSHFANGSIDLLHIDGRHFYEDVQHDFKSWVPKLSERAIVLFHDTNVRERGFGVYKLWEELRVAHPSFGFLHCHGLGVLGYGSKLPPQLEVLLSASKEPNELAAVRAAYSRLGGALTERHELAKLQRSLSVARSKENALQASLGERDQKITMLEERLNGRFEGNAKLTRLLRQKGAPPWFPKAKPAAHTFFPTRHWSLRRERHRAAREMAALKHSGLFDVEWYLKTYPDVAASGVDPLRHYVQFGAAEGRRPNASAAPGACASRYR